MLSINSVLQYATLFTVVIGIWGVAISLLNNRRQINAQIYLDISSRLQQFYKEIPVEARYAHLSGAQIEADEKIVYSKVLDFLSLVHSALALHESNFIHGSLWKSLHSEICHGLNTPVCLTCWPTLRAQFTHRPNVIAFVDLVQNASGSK